jgi:glycosyltransferase involved in cell wall biosynthesis
VTVAPQRPVLIVDLSKRFGGTNVRVLALARRLDGNHPYGVAVLAGSPLHERLQAEKLRALAVPFGRGDPRVLPYLVRGIRRGSYGVVDAHNPQSQLWAGLAAAVAGTPSVTTVHSAYRDEHAGSARGRAYEAVLRLNRRAGARFVAVSNTIRAYLRRLGVPEERITVVENGLPPRPAVRPADGVREALGWSTDVFVVTSVGRLEPVKGHELLVEAVRQLAPGRPTLRCLIVGDGRRRRALEAHVRAAGLDDRIRLVGFRDDVGPVLAASDAFCLPSRSEGLPYALLEACAHGLPIIATAVGEMGALLEDGRTARVVLPDDAEAVAGAIAWLMDHEHEARALGDAASALADRRFGAERMVAETLEVYAA